jgi:hypothetical protein
MERAFDAPKGLQTPLHGHTLLLGCLSLIFFKKLILAQGKLIQKFKSLREVTHIRFYLVFIWFLFGLEPGWEKASQKS